MALVYRVGNLYGVEAIREHYNGVSRTVYFLVKLTIYKCTWRTE